MTCSSANKVNRLRKSWLCVWALLFCLSCSEAFAQETPQFQPALFLRANDRFALDLLTVTLGQAPDRNIVLAPFPVSLTFAALWDGTSDIESMKEIVPAFHWDKSPGVGMAARMLLKGFEKPKPYPVSHAAPPKTVDRAWLNYMRSGKPEELWISGAFLYRVQGSLSQDFIDRVKYDYGFTFRAVGEHTAQSAILEKNWDASLPMPAIKGQNDFWGTSFTHLRTSWTGNTFIGAKREKHDFTLRSGNVVQADFLKSEFEVYPYVRADEFEGVVLSCWQASILLVLPAPDKDIGQLAAALARDPNMIEPFLVRREGDVELPPFHFSYETDLRSSLEKMGVHRIFRNPDTLLSMAPKRAGGILQGVAQKTEITVDENGIRADAGTILHGVYGGVLAVESPFHMVLNRPFLFIVRENATNALLFIGVVMNPNLQ
jgi:serine protease inhibitor